MQSDSLWWCLTNKGIKLPHENDPTQKDESDADAVASAVEPDTAPHNQQRENHKSPMLRAVSRSIVWLWFCVWRIPRQDVFNFFLVVFTGILSVMAVRQYNLSQRTVIAEVGNSEATPITNGKTTLTFKNTGQTKALNVRVELFYSGFDSVPSDFDPFTEFAKLGDIKIDQLQATRDAQLEAFKNEHLPEAEMNAIRKNWEDIMRQAPRRASVPPASLPPAYVREIPANTPVPYYVPIQQQFPVTFVFGHYRYYDELSQPHEGNVCWRFESDTVSSCLMFQPVKR
jgi:hypothetical protein